jgi:hypothetical protein
VIDAVVYVLGTPGSNTVKIGRTTNLAKRLGDIQRMSPVPLSVLWQCPGASELETRLHRHFAHLRSHGEWFTFDSTDPVPLIQAAAQQLATRRTAPTVRREKLDEEALQKWYAALDDATMDHQQRRVELEESIADCRAAGLPLTLISDHTPFSREWVRKIADRVDRERAA